MLLAASAERSLTRLHELLPRWTVTSVGMTQTSRSAAAPCRRRRPLDGGAVSPVCPSNQALAFGG
jgi:hypothetical protein